MDTTIQRTILRSLFYNEDYVRQVLPFLKAEYFQEQNERRLFKEVAEFIGKYNKPPTVEAVSVNLGNADDVRSQEALDTMKGILDQIEQNRDQKVEMKWLVDESEKFCKDQALYNAIMDSIQILDGKGKNKTLQKTAIPEIVSKALSVSFDNRIGHDYLEDYENRYEMYHRKEEKVQFHLQSLNRITRGGIGKKTLNILLAGTNVGKSIFMCDFAAHSLKQGLNVLYITCEMAEERIGERIDMNLLDLNTDDLYTIPKETYEKKLQKIKQATKGRLYVKEYPTAAAHVGHFKFLLDELKLKKNFVPDIVFI
jgi:replicative DNA helicase